MVRIIIFLLTLSQLAPFSWAGECQDPILSYRHINGYTINICKAAFIPFPPNLNQLSSSKDQPSRALLISLKIGNYTSVKKIDLNSHYNFYLKDNYLNKYHLLDIAKSDAENITNKQSLYPQESISHSLIFETPIEKFQELILSIDSIEPGMNTPIHLAIPKDRITIDDKDLITKQVGSYEINITSPSQNASVLPNSVVPLKLAFADSVPLPSSIYIISKDYVLEDTKSSLRYDIRIPPGPQDESFTIHIIAKWDINNEIYHISKTLFLKVLDPAKKCLINCLKANQ